MELPQREGITEWVGRTVVDPQGKELGRCEHLYADKATGLPEWLSVRLDDGRTRFVPLTDATGTGDRVQVVFARDQVASAPGFPVSGELQPEQEVELYRHYRVPYSTDASDTVLPTDGPATGGTTPPAVPEPAAQPAPDSTVDDRDVADTATGPAEEAPVAPPVVGRVRRLEFPPPPAPAVESAPPAPTGRPDLSVVGSGPSAALPPRSGASALEPGLLGAAAAGLAVYAAVRALRSRRRTTPAERAAAQLRAAGTTARRAAQVQAAAAGRSARRAGLEAGRAAATAAQTASSARDQLARTTAAQRRELARAGAARRAQAAAARAARRRELAAARARAVEGLSAAGRGVAGRTSGLTTGLTTGTGTAVRRRGRRTAAEAREIAAGVVSLPGDAARAAGGRAVTTSARTGRRLRRSWRRATRRLALVLGLAGGYVTGARAGEQRYEQIVAGIEQVSARPEVQQVRRRLDDALGRGPGGDGAGV